MREIYQELIEINARPQTARAIVNCRVLPNESEEDVRQTLIPVLANDKITVTPVTDSRYLRAAGIPAYGTAETSTTSGPMGATSDSSCSRSTKGRSTSTD